jgi:hypothetical protein
MPVVFYTGFGAKPSGLHTPLEFLRYGVAPPCGACLRQGVAPPSGA